MFSFSIPERNLLLPSSTAPIPPFPAKPALFPAFFSPPHIPTRTLADMKTASYFFLISLLLPPTLVAQDTAEVPIAHAYNLEEQAHHDEVIALIRPLIESNTL